MSWEDTYKISNYYGNAAIKNDSSLTVNTDKDKICSNYTLTVDDDCDDNINQLPSNIRELYLDIRDFMPFENESYEEELENGFGIGIRSIYIQKRWVTFPAIVNTYHYSILSAYQGMTYFELDSLESTEQLIFDRLEVESQEKLTKDRFTVNIRMRLKDNAV
jgi:hypothetical protein